MFHNLKGYDSHLIIKEAYKLNSGNISVIPNNFEKFMSFKIGDLKFLDSFQFLSSSLEQLSKNLYDETDKFKYLNNMKKFFPDINKTLCQKGHYPYEWFDSTDKFDYEGLPPKECFYSSLKQEGISDEDYEHAKKVYTDLNCKTFRDYHMAYLRTDVLLLSDVFENFRATCMNYYGLDPANYITVPGFAWDCMLKQTDIKL